MNIMTINSEKFNPKSPTICLNQARPYGSPLDALLLDLITQIVGYWRRTLEVEPQEKLEDFLAIMENDLLSAGVSYEHPLRFYLREEGGLYTGALIAYAIKAGLSELSIPEEFIFDSSTKETSKEMYVVPGAAIIIEEVRREEQRFPIVKEVIFDGSAIPFDGSAIPISVIVLTEFLCRNVDADLASDNESAILELRGSFSSSARSHFSKQGADYGELLSFGENGLPAQRWFLCALTNFFKNAANENVIWLPGTAICVSPHAVIAFSLPTGDAPFRAFELFIR